MRRCRECGQPIADETPQERLHRNLFVWTFMSVFFCGMVLTAPHPRTSDDYIVRAVTLLPVAVALYFWVKFFRERFRRK